MDRACESGPGPVEAVAEDQRKGGGGVPPAEPASRRVCEYVGVQVRVKV
jgi:hypothetical protein